MSTAAQFGRFATGQNQQEEILIFTRLEVLNRQRVWDYNSHTHDTIVRVNPGLHAPKIYENSIGIVEWFNV